LEESGSAKGITLLKILAQFATNFSNKVDGKGQGSTEAMAEMTELYGGARISYIFNEIFGRRLRTLDPFEGLADEDIRTAIANANGTRPSLFVPEISFDLLVRKQIVRLEQPGLDCLDKVHDEMLRMVRCVLCVIVLMCYCVNVLMFCVFCVLCVFYVLCVICVLCVLCFVCVLVFPLTSLLSPLTSHLSPLTSPPPHTHTHVGESVPNTRAIPLPRPQR
jgi:hypothetical protein